MTDTSSADIPLTAGKRPEHVAIIMDGNNRWARERGQGGVSGHRAGVNSVRSTVETCAREGVSVLTLFAFSSENWRRPKDEISALMRLLLMALEREVRKLHRNNIRLRIIGDRTAFSERIQAHMDRAEVLTANNTGMTLVVAANYGGHWDITCATRRLAEKVQRGELAPEAITDDLVQQQLSIGDLPMPDLLIRTAGEQRISNFLLWHLAYTEFYFSPVYWPDFGPEEMRGALAAYGQRKRRFGQTDDQVDADEAPHVTGTDGP
ncbi:undecaprenyl diphosphate synthase [Tamilnaduibacter salinus]|uniref:Ditrans,polycis-undecaprenyl-diphosphate synthase ((2E,6E)-farnesyl-diphosphate specific) n=1 Tax=Tamilnaduibacter salinus TaxID=1484056 RepID=A0A2U1CTA3_9GAMM|nr:polyprenyl diphosphate synthase [Tamilnaduibacter salinus]PVY69788.1 undecaprenyl diphosphate synthase [Tamilnaduibacter salinus]